MRRGPSRSIRRAGTSGGGRREMVVASASMSLACRIAKPFADRLAGVARAVFALAPATVNMYCAVRTTRVQGSTPSGVSPFHVAKNIGSHRLQEAGEGLRATSRRQGVGLPDCRSKGIPVGAHCACGCVQKRFVGFSNADHGRASLDYDCDLIELQKIIWRPVVVLARFSVGEDRVGVVDVSVQVEKSR